MSRVIVEAGGLRRAAQYLDKPCKVAVISDSSVMPLYGQTVADALTDAGFAPVVHSIPAGEAHKNVQTYARLLAFLADARLTRSDLVLALGGGVVSDMAGFAAATYLRGVRWAALPTTLLAQVDAAIGGKTAIDLDQGKNLAGAFHPPELVLSDPGTLDTLPAQELSSGMAEVIKYAVSLDAEMLAHLPFGKDEREGIIRRCADIKVRVVSEDPKDNGWRQVLNFGHTFGHAVEHVSGYALSHGEAVSVGMAVIVRACARQGILPEEACDRVLDTLHRAGLPTRTDADADTLFSVVAHDKKRRGDDITLVLLKDVGQAYLERMPLQRARALLDAGLTP